MQTGEQMLIWPAAMRRSTAARYLDLSETEFSREVASGRLPSAFRLGRSEHWSKDAIDVALGLGAEPAEDNWRGRQKAYQTDPEATEREPFEIIRSARKVLTPEDLASRWGMSIAKIYKMFHAGEVRGFRLGAKLIRFRPEEAFLAEERLQLR